MKFKNYILFTAVFVGLVFMNCDDDKLSVIETDTINENYSSGELMQNKGNYYYLESEFDKNKFVEIIPYQFNVLWNKTNKKYSKDLNVHYYEFSLEYLNEFNPSSIGKEKTSGYQIKYSLIVTTSIEKYYKFYVAKYYQRIHSITNSSSKDVSFDELDKFDGVLHLIDSNNDIVYARRIDNGEVDSKKYFGKEFKKMEDQNRMIEDCIDVLTYNYTEWYKITSSGIWRTSIVLNSVTISRDCISYWRPDLIRDGSGGSGIYRNSGSGGVYNDCEDPVHPCLYDIRDEIELPCPGDPVPNPEIAPQKNSGMDGGLHGTCTRPGKICNGTPGIRPHDGVDIKNAFGEPIYAMYDGVARLATQTNSKGELDGAGYHVSITSIINGQTVRLVYFHLQEDNQLSGSVKAGDIIGYQGDSGNLKAAIEQGHTESHVHIKAQLNGKMANPLDYFATTIDAITGQIKNPCQ